MQAAPPPRVEPVEIGIVLDAEGDPFSEQVGIRPMKNPEDVDRLGSNQALIMRSTGPAFRLPLAPEGAFRVRDARRMVEAAARWRKGRETRLHLAEGLLLIKCRRDLASRYQRYSRVRKGRTHHSGWTPNDTVRGPRDLRGCHMVILDAPNVNDYP
jgi:hypothetical protein